MADIDSEIAKIDRRIEGLSKYYRDKIRELRMTRTSLLRSKKLVEKIKETDKDPRASSHHQEEGGVSQTK